MLTFHSGVGPASYSIVAAAFCVLLAVTSRPAEARAATDDRRENASLADGLVQAPPTRADSARAAFIRIPFITNRKIDPDAISRARQRREPVGYESVFLNRMSASIAYGEAVVTYPIDRAVGEQRYSASTKDENPFYHFSIWDYRLFADQVRLRESFERNYGKMSDRELLVYVHGMDNSFTEAVERLAQLSIDLKTKAIPLAFSWPSDVARTAGDRPLNPPFPSDYIAILDAAGKSVKYFVHGLNVASGMAPHLYVLSHSIGAVVVTGAVTDLMKSRRDAAQSNGLTIVDSLAMAAPDVGLDAFRDLRLPDLTGGVGRITVYCSDDRALYFSEKVNRGEARLGRCSGAPTKLPGVQTVKVTGSISDFARHSYFLSGRNVIENLKHEFLDLRPRPNTGGSHHFDPVFIDVDK